MHNTLFNKIVPGNIHGKSTDLQQSVTTATREEAVDTFNSACKRLLNVKIWHLLSGFGSGEFKLMDATGNEVHRLAQAGDYFQIDMPGPGTISGEGYDWVMVETVENNSNADGEEENLGIRVRPCSNPNKTGNDTSHFFTNDATSSFIIERKNNTVTACYYGRNEVLNTGVNNIADKLRNAVAGTFALLGISEMQWKSLIKSFLEKEV